MTRKRIALVTAGSAILIVLAWVGLTMGANVGVDFSLPRVDQG